jgi:hypothetical protein
MDFDAILLAKICDLPGVEAVLALVSIRNYDTWKTHAGSGSPDHCGGLGRAHHGSRSRSPAQWVSRVPSLRYSPSNRTEPSYSLTPSIRPMYFAGMAQLNQGN